MTCASGYLEDYVDYDSPESRIWREKRVVGRKRYKCCECGRVIEIGERQDYVECLDENGWGSGRRCIECSTLAELITTEHGACPQWYLLREIAKELGYDWDSFHEAPQ